MNKNQYVVIFRSTTAHDVFPKDTAFEKIVKSFGFSIFEADVNNIPDMIAHLLNLQENHNAKIIHLVIRAHGLPTGMHIGYDVLDIRIKNHVYENFMTFIQVLNMMITDCASVFLHSCSVGKESFKQESFANFMSKQLSNPIFASNQIIRMGDLLIDSLPDDMIFDFPIFYRVRDDIKYKNEDYKILLFYNGKIDDTEIYNINVNYDNYNNYDYDNNYYKYEDDIELMYYEQFAC